MGLFVFVFLYMRTCTYTYTTRDGGDAKEHDKAFVFLFDVLQCVFSLSTDCFVYLMVIFSVPVALAFLYALYVLHV